MRWQNVPWLVILPQMVFATVGLLVAYWLTHFVPEWGTLLYIFCPLTFLLLFNGTWWYLKARPERGRLHRERAGLAPSDRPIITHTGPPMFQGQYQVRWIRTPFESLGAAILIIVLSLGALIGTFYVLYGDTKVVKDLTVWAMRPMPLSMGALVALTLESVAAVMEDDERLKATGAWIVIDIVAPIFFKWMWFLPPMSGDLFSASLQGAILPQGLVFGTMVILSIYAWWKSNGDAKDVPAGFVVVWVVVIWGLQKSAINALLH